MKEGLRGERWMRFQSWVCLLAELDGRWACGNELEKMGLSRWKVEADLQVRLDRLPLFFPP